MGTRGDAPPSRGSTDMTICSNPLSYSHDLKAMIFSHEVLGAQLELRIEFPKFMDTSTS